jgi:hypothetical protein
MHQSPHVAPPTPSAQQRGAQLSQFVHDTLVASARLATIPTVDAVAALLVERDGAYVVSGHTFTDPAAASAERLLVAHAVRLDVVRGFALARALERASARHLWTEGERTCAWCDSPIRALDDAEELGLKLVHHACARAFDAWANEPDPRDVRRDAEMPVSEPRIAAPCDGPAPVLDDDDAAF